ncbi:MAG: malto-oligosyltrehalose trehalohydrolase [Nitrospira sp.]|nr:malto-oligosyltrehalose trehalohydrolase [Nitrospira sp.]
MIDTGGRCGVVASADGALEWRVWAPQAKEVDMILIDGSRRHVQPMTPEPHGHFLYRRQSVSVGQRYMYSLDKGADRADPASRWQPDGVNQPSAVLLPAKFEWSDGNWHGVAREDLVFYEIHVGTFTTEGTFDAIIPRLPALRELGITAIELMPVGQFPGTRNWGYDGVHLFAPQQSYGGPSGLQRLVNACHAEGLACVLDVVYNHVGPEGSCLSDFGPYFTEHYRTPWGHAVNYDGPGSDVVRAFVTDNVRMWIQDYHMDGLRLDAVHAIYDFGARHILQDIKDEADRAAEGRGYPAHIVAESDLNDVRLLLPTKRGGYGLDGQWSDDFHHTVHTLLTGERQGYYEDYGEAEQLRKVMQDTFVLDGCYSNHRERRHGAPTAGLPGDRFVGCIQNHDQIGNRAAGERLGALISPPAQRLAATLLLMAPHLPLLFMGEEYGEEHPFQFFCSFEGEELIEAVRRGRKREFEAFHTDGVEAPDPQAESTYQRCRLTWSWQDQPHKAGLRRLYTDLFDARRSWPALRNFSERAARLHPGPDGHAVLEFGRGGVKPDGEHTIQVFYNLTDDQQALPVGERPTFLFSSESTRYAGGRAPEFDRTHLLPFECMVFGPSDCKTYGGE